MYTFAWFGEVLICHTPPVFGSVCCVMMWLPGWLVPQAWVPPTLAKTAAIPVTLPGGPAWLLPICDGPSWPGEGEESGDDVIDVTRGIWTWPTSCLMCVRGGLYIVVPPCPACRLDPCVAAWYDSVPFDTTGLPIIWWCAGTCRCRKTCNFRARSLLYIGPNLFLPPRILSCLTAVKIKKGWRN